MKPPKKVNHLKHIFQFLVAGFIIFWVFLLLGNLYYEKISPKNNITFGVSFSWERASDLGLDPVKTYKSVLSDLGVKSLRLPTYWNKIEAKEDSFDFSKLDFLINEAEKNDAKIILVVGSKQPGWPECHIPKWALSLPLEQRQDRVLKFIQEVTLRYANSPTITALQVENEQLLQFGLNCDPPNREFLKKEVALVRSKTRKPIIITDSGELRGWITPTRLSDIFGTTLYRKVFDRTFGYLYYPIPPAFYSFKANAIRRVFASNNQKAIITELQAEPWTEGSLSLMPIDQQLKVFSVKDLEKNIDYAKKSGFDEVYLWGVEWWYFMKEKGHPEYLEKVKTLID
jgi:hypothetical protein